MKQRLKCMEEEIVRLFGCTPTDDARTIHNRIANASIALWEQASLDLQQWFNMYTVWLEGRNFHSAPTFLWVLESLSAPPPPTIIVRPMIAADLGMVTGLGGECLYLFKEDDASGAMLVAAGKMMDEQPVPPRRVSNNREKKS